MLFDVFLPADKALVQQGGSQGPGHASVRTRPQPVNIATLSYLYNNNNNNNNNSAAAAAAANNQKLFKRTSTSSSINSYRHEDCFKPKDPSPLSQILPIRPLAKTSVSSVVKSRIRSPTPGVLSDENNEERRVSLYSGVPTVIQPFIQQMERTVAAAASAVSADGVGPVTSGRRPDISIRKPGSQSAAKSGAGANKVNIIEPTPLGDGKKISNDIQSKAWKAVRFSSTFSRGCNTPITFNATKSVQTVSTTYMFRLNRWPSCGDGGRHSSSSPTDFYYPQWARQFFAFVFSQFGIVLFLSAWICAHAALFQHLEQQPDLKLVNEVVTGRNDLVVTLATELRQVFPYEMAWRRKIDDYFIKFETILNNATQRGYSTTKRTFYKWDYFDFVLFSLQLVTGQGYGSDVPKTEWSLLASIPCVLIGLPFMWLFLLDLGAKWADALSMWVQKIRWKMSHRYPDVVALQEDGLVGPKKSFLHSQLAYQNGAAVGSGSSPVVQPYSNGKGARMSNGLESHPVSVVNKQAFHTDEDEDDTNRSAASVWTVQPMRAELNVPIAPVKMFASQEPLIDEDQRHHATPWISTAIIILYPIAGSTLFGLWAGMSAAESASLSLTSLVLISPPAASVASLWWRAAFHLYLLVGWVLFLACCILWHQSWLRLLTQWAYDLSVKPNQHRTFPLHPSSR